MLEICLRREPLKQPLGADWRLEKWSVAGFYSNLQGDPLLAAVVVVLGKRVKGIWN